MKDEMNQIRGLQLSTAAVAATAAFAAQATDQKKLLRVTHSSKEKKHLLHPSSSG